MLPWEPPYRGELEVYGTGFGDIVEGPGNSLLVTERFANDFKAEGMTGLGGFHPVEILRVSRKRRGRKLGPPPQYLYVTTAYGQAAKDMERSRILGRNPVTCTWCRYVGSEAIDGLALEAGTWAGEDVFRARGLSGTIIVSERFMQFAERRAVSHLAMVPIEKYVWDPAGHFYPRAVQRDPPKQELEWGRHRGAGVPEWYSELPLEGTIRGGQGGEDGKAGKENINLGQGVGD